MSINRRRSLTRACSLAVLGALFAILPIQPLQINAQVGDIDAEYRDPNISDLGWQIVILRDRSPGNGFSHLMNGSAEHLCKSMADPNCSGSSDMNSTAILQVCTATVQIDCIVEFGAASVNESAIPAIYAGTFPTVGRNDYAGDSASRLPNGGPPSVWTIPSLSHAGGDNYLVQVQVRGGNRTGKFTIADFSIQIDPIELVSDVCIQGNHTRSPCHNQGPGFYEGPKSEVKYDETGKELPRETQIRNAARISDSPFDCVLVAQDLCARRHAFPSNARLYIKVRLSQSPIGWMHGRISNPAISITRINGSNSAVEVSVIASTVTTPIIATATAWTNLPAPLQDAYRATGGFNGNSAGTRNPTSSSDPALRNSISHPTSYSDVGMSELLKWLPYVGDRATANISRWTIRSLSDSELLGTSNCFSDTTQLNGIVMTNATQYSSGPPTFDKTSGSLEYTVAAPHYTSSGNVFLGTYDLVMRSDVARCLYGFSKAPLNASISVVDNGGVSTIATKLVSEKDGWLRIAAYGFGFSNPTIKVKLTQSEVASTTRTKVGKKITIVCVKQKEVRQVTALKPACPKGFKKKT